MKTTPEAIPGCKPWRTANPRKNGKRARVCPSVHCARCAQVRLDRGIQTVLPNDFLVLPEHRTEAESIHLEDLGLTRRQFGRLPRMTP